MVMFGSEQIEMLRGLEEDLWREETRFDIAYMKRIIAEDYIEFGRSGRTYDRASVLAAPRQPIVAVIPLPNFQARSLSDSIAQVTYDSHVVYEGAVLYAHRSSIWSLEPDGWKLRFHQGTPYEAAP